MSRQFISDVMPQYGSTPVVKGRVRRSTVQKDRGGEKFLSAEPAHLVAKADEPMEADRLTRALAGLLGTRKAPRPEDDSGDA